MTATDFEFGGSSLSSRDFEICQFDSSGGFTTSPAGSTITFTKIFQRAANKFSIVDATYESGFEASLSIMKHDGEVIDTETYAEISRWLCRPTNEQLRFIGGGLDYVYFEGTFSMEKVEHRGRIVGFNLTFTSARTHGTLLPVLETLTLETNVGYAVADLSDEVGFTYPDMLTVTIKESGTLRVTNGVEDREMVIQNCEVGETIQIDCVNKIITTTSDRDILDAFNFNFFRLANNYDNIENVITSSLACDFNFVYTPIKKVVF